MPEKPVQITDSKKGFIIGFDKNNPLFGPADEALLFDIDEAISLCFELDNPDCPTLNTVQVVTKKELELNDKEESS